MPKEAKEPTKKITMEELLAEREALAAEVERLKSQGLPGYSPEDAAFIRERVALGLNREQAEQVLKDQRAWEKHPNHPDNLAAAALEKKKGLEATLAEHEKTIADLKKQLAEREVPASPEPPAQPKGKGKGKAEAPASPATPEPVPVPEATA